MSEDPTLPPRQPNTFRTWLPRIWKWATAAVSANPDISIIVFLSLLLLAFIL